MTTPQQITFVDVIRAGLCEFCGMPSTAAEQLARAIARAAAAAGHAGADYYLPALHTLTRADRDAAIRAEFNGQNLELICRKYGVHRATVYRAVKRAGV